MKSRRWLALPALVLSLSSLLLAKTINPDDDTERPPALGATADLSTAPRVGVDRPKPTFPLYERDKRVLRGLHLTGSGDSHDTDDSCLDVRGHSNVIENLVIDNCLFGIDLKQSNDNIVRNNKVRSKPRDLGVRGDGLRLWYSTAT
jgi:nitrous oxidase accessory protein